MMAPTFFIPAVVLRRHPELIKEVARHGAEIGVHGYVHTDYRLLKQDKQYEQTRLAASIFEQRRIAFRGFRNPYLGWTEETLDVFRMLEFGYESNEAVLHDVIDVANLSPLFFKERLRKIIAAFSGYSLQLLRLTPAH